MVDEQRDSLAHGGGLHTLVELPERYSCAQLGLAIGLTVGPAQQYLSHFIYHARAMLQHYEPPVGWTQWKTFIRETRNLESFRSGLTSRMQQGAVTGALSIASQVAVLRQFNSGWSANFGGFEYSFYRKLATIMASAIVSSPTGVLVDMVTRAYYADKTFPKELQKGYKNWLDAFKRIPFEEGPYYLFKNTFPLYIKHIIGPFTAFFCFDFLIDKVSVLWRTTNMPVLPLILSCALFGTYLGAVFTYPFAVTAREMVDLWPKKSSEAFGGNYRKAAVYIWFHQNILIFYPGFFKRYFWHIAPQYSLPYAGGSSPSSWLRSWASSNTGESTSSTVLLTTPRRTALFDRLQINNYVSLGRLLFPGVAH